MAGKLKKIALLAGMGPESTLDYYRGIIDAFKPRYDETGNPEILIDSLNLKHLLASAEHGKWREMAEELAGHFEAMRAAGAEIGAMASNTPHKIFDDIQQQTALPLISIVEATRTEAVREHAKRLLLLGTKFTMSSDFYFKAFTQSGISLLVPDAGEQNYINDKIFAEIEHGIIRKETKQHFLEIIGRRPKQALDGVILGCTEFSIILKKEDIDGLYLNTTDIHFDAIVRACLDEDRTA